MRIDGFTLSEGSSVANLTIASGTSFPVQPNKAELFYKEEADQNFSGLYIYVPNSWHKIEAGAPFEEASLVPAYTAVVNKNPKLGEFSSISAAIAEIPTITGSEHWMVLVYPGEYVEPTIAIPSQVHIVGTSEHAISVSPVNTTDPLFVLENQSSISFLTISNATGANQQAVKLYNLEQLGGTGCFLNRLHFKNCTNSITIQSTTADSIVHIRDCKIDFTSGIGLSITAANGFSSFVVVNDIDISSSGTNATGAIVVAGSTECKVTGFSFFGNSSTGVSVSVQDGGKLDLMAGVIDGWATGLRMPSPGAAPAANIEGVVFSNNTNYDLLVQHTTASGGFSGTANKNKVDISATSLFSLSFRDAVNNLKVLAGDVFVDSGSIDVNDNPIVNASSINGIDILSHASRHAPDGADAIATSAATTLNLASTNTIGTANSLARSDHTHELTGIQPLDADLTAIAAISSTGLSARTAANTWTTRSLVAGSAKVTVADGDGVAGNPTIDVSETDLSLNNISGVLGTSKGGTGLSSLGTADQLLGVNSGATTAEYKALATGAGISIVHAAGLITFANTGILSFSTGTTGLSSTTTSGAVTLSGTLSPTNGGTGLSSLGTSNQFLAVNSAGTTAEYKTISNGSGISLTHNAGSLSIANTGILSISAGTTGLIATTTSGATTLSGVLDVDNGGTGLSSTPSNGQLDIGNGTGFTRAALTQGNAMTITNGAGSIKVAYQYPHSIVQMFFGPLTVATGTSTIPYGSAAPKIANGTQVWSQVITPSLATSLVKVTLTSTVAFAGGDSGVIAALFRGSVLIDAQVVTSVVSGGATNTGSGIISFAIVDDPASTAAQTYSLRVGSLSTIGGTWYFGRTNLQTLANAAAGTFSVMEMTA